MDEQITSNESEIQRVPIIGLKRVPITSKAEEELNWDEVYKKLVNYIKFAAKQVADQYQTGVVNTAEDLFQEGQILLYNCYLTYIHKNISEFTAIFKTSLWRKLREFGVKSNPVYKAGSDSENVSVTMVDIEDAYDLGYSEDVIEDLYNEYKLQQVAELLDGYPIAMTILKEFLSPSSRTIWEAEMDIARKEMLKAQNYSVAVPKSIVIRGIHVQRALGISKEKFKQNYKLMKESVAKIYEFHTGTDVEMLLQDCV